ncbi:4'-phosphopantetheinyl transferase superfamily protein [Mesonia sp. MT50]|uniref:4'-phosphopantetheinyl transferase superfamily protein n=1 Tax=Mesonia profundi TaxID=3070998 RepID=A0ABU0ZXY7_9FLAO|nr:4'-phosphopantetheinyl transferase superfamily protein [Mesonia profundi]MDQ7916272.1 4'-phosphopantetheinyl transferase superfamily protein [Mesonia profundi]
MALYKTITIDEATKVLIWKIEESFEWLSEGIELTPHCRNRVDSMKSDLHRRGFMCIRHLLAAEGYVDHDLYYDDHGKPHLKDGKFISITHSFTFAGIIISDQPIGIDIEKQREKIMKIAHKFTPLKEYRTLANDDAIIRKLTIVWGAKESIYKYMSVPGLLFLHHIYVDDFDFDEMKTTAKVNYQGKEESFKIDYLEFEGFTCVYALPL